MSDEKGAKPRQYHRHGHYALKKALETFGTEAWIDKLGATGEALRCWRTALIDDLGGEDALSTQKLALVDLCCRQWLMIEHVDRFILINDAIVNKRNRRLFRVMLDRQRLVDSLAKMLDQLGLERREEPLDWSKYVEVAGADDSGDDGG